MASCPEEAVYQAAQTRRGPGHSPTERFQWVSASLLSSAKKPINGFYNLFIITKLESA